MSQLFFLHLLSTYELGFLEGSEEDVFKQSSLNISSLDEKASIAPGDHVIQAVLAKKAELRCPAVRSVSFRASHKWFCFPVQVNEYLNVCEMVPW